MSWATVGVIARKEFRDVIREKTLVIAFLVQLFIAGFSALLLAGLLALSDGGDSGLDPSVPVAYTGPGDFRDYMLQQGIRVEIRDLDDAWSRFDLGEVGAIVIEEVGATHNLTIVLAEGELQTSLVVTSLQAALTHFEDDLRMDRADRLESTLVNLPVPARDASYEFVFGSLVPVLVLVPVVLAGAIAGDSLAQERRAGTLTVLRSTSAPLWTAVAGKLLVPIALVPIQVALWSLLLAANGYVIHLPAVLLLATVLGAILAGLGLLLTVRVQDEAVGQAAYAVLVLIVGALSLFMPRDPLNMLALFAAGVPDAISWWTLAIMAIVTVPLLYVATRVVERNLRHQ